MSLDIYTMGIFISLAACCFLSGVACAFFYFCIKSVIKIRVEKYKQNLLKDKDEKIKGLKNKLDLAESEVKHLLESQNKGKEVIETNKGKITESMVNKIKKKRLSLPQGSNILRHKSKKIRIRNPDKKAIFNFENSEKHVSLPEFFRRGKDLVFGTRVFWMNKSGKEYGHSYFVRKDKDGFYYYFKGEDGQEWHTTFDQIRLKVLLNNDGSPVLIGDCHGS